MCQNESTCGKGLKKINGISLQMKVKLLNRVEDFEVKGKIAFKNVYVFFYCFKKSSAADASKCSC